MRNDTIMSSMRAYFRNQIQEIQNDQALRLYGIFVAFAHLLTYFFWHTKGYYNRISNDIDPICWPFWESCFQYRFFDASQAENRGQTPIFLILFFDK